MDQTFDNDRIIKINIEEEMKSSYIDYSMSVIVARALPDVRDGFKPTPMATAPSMVPSYVWPRTGTCVTRS